MILNDSGGSKKITYPKPSKGISGITKPKTPIKKSAPKPKAKSKSTSYKGGGNTGLLDKFVHAVKKDVHKAVKWATKPGHLVPTKIHNVPTTGFTNKKPATKKPVVKKPAPKPLSQAGLDPSKYHAATKKPKSNALGQAGLSPNKYHTTNSVPQSGLDPKKYTTTAKKTTTSKPVVTKPVVKTTSAPKTGVYNPPRPSSVTTSKAPVPTSTPVPTPVPTGGTGTTTTKPVTPTSSNVKNTSGTPYQSSTGGSGTNNVLNDPYAYQRYLLSQDKYSSLKAQDIALNKGLTTQDANNFQQMQGLQQQMANRGMGSSGIAADTYMRATMGANQNYQQAYADAATKKSDIQSQYDKAISQSMIDQMQYMDKMAIAQSESDAKFAAQQTEQDKYLTSATGFVYVGGQRLMIGGKPVTSMDWNKLSETQRHNMATENITATANAQDYSLGLDKNAIAREKVANDLQISINKNKLDYAKLDYNYAKLESTNEYNQSKLQVAIANAQTSKDKNQLSALGKQSDSLAKQIAAYQKAGNKPPKSLVDKYNQTNNAISGIVGGASFKTSGGGGDYRNAPSGTPQAFGGYRRVNQAPAQFNQQMSQAISRGVPFAQAKLLTELIGRESGFRATAKNPTSTAYGYGQFLTSTRNAYAKKYPNLNYNNPVDQIVLTWKYVQERYGTAQHALEMWEKRKPHWY